MRIVAGEFGGRRLLTPRSDAIRPSSDRLRQTLFDVLAHGYDDAVRSGPAGETHDDLDVDVLPGEGRTDISIVSPDDDGRGPAFVDADERAERSAVAEPRDTTFGEQSRLWFDALWDTISSNLLLTS